MKSMKKLFVAIEKVKRKADLSVICDLPASWSIKKEDGEDWSELEEPAETQEAISEKRNTLTEQKGDLEARLAEMLTEQLEVNMPPSLKEEKRLNVILVGPKSCGRTTVANFLAQEHQRSVIRLDQLVDFW